MCINEAAYLLLKSVDALPNFLIVSMLNHFKTMCVFIILILYLNHFSIFNIRHDILFGGNRFDFLKIGATMIQINIFGYHII